MLRQAFPHGIRIDLPLNELLPQHAVRYDSEPFLANQFSRTQRLGIQIRQNDLGNEQ